MTSIRVHDVVGVGGAKERVIVLSAVGIGIELRLATHTIARVHDSVVGRALQIS